MVEHGGSRTQSHTSCLICSTDLPCAFQRQSQDLLSLPGTVSLSPIIAQLPLLPVLQAESWPWCISAVGTTGWKYPITPRDKGTSFFSTTQREIVLVLAFLKQKVLWILGVCLFDSGRSSFSIYLSSCQQLPFQGWWRYNKQREEKCPLQGVIQSDLINKIRLGKRRKTICANFSFLLLFTL